jgi:formamidopyrimidine-DNA glycosylase
MPELPEVETTRLGIRPHLVNRAITEIIVREPRLRRPITDNINTFCVNQKVLEVSRRAKYLILHLSQGVILIHLGMSGHLRINSVHTSWNKHDHIDLRLDNDTLLRYHDPRRFGLFLYIDSPLHLHPLFRLLGPEPLSSDFTGEYLFRQAQSKKQNVKSFIMNSQVVVGVGNIYAAESLFLAGIHPSTPAGLLNLLDFTALAKYIQQVLTQSIQAGGTTLRDFYNSDGKPGYFANELLVYGKKNYSCTRCQSIIESIIIAGRNSFYCPKCQPLLSK